MSTIYVPAASARTAFLTVSANLLQVGRSPRRCPACPHGFNAVVENGSAWKPSVPSPLDSKGPIQAYMPMKPHLGGFTGVAGLS
jgi:hypothetical protein